MTIYDFLRDCLGVLRERVDSLSTAPEIEGLLLTGGQSRHASRRAVDSFLSGRLAQGDDALFGELSLGKDPAERARAIMRDEIVAGRLAIGVAEDIVSGFADLETRVTGGFAAWMTLPHSALPPDVARYYARVIRLYVAGGTLELFVFCRSMLEAALAIRIPDTHLRAIGEKPNHKNEFYSTGQRKRALRKLDVLTSSQWFGIDEVQRYGNKVAHGQVSDLPDPGYAVILACASVGIIVGSTGREGGSALAT